jgi:hypothetical protein
MTLGAATVFTYKRHFVTMNLTFLASSFWLLILILIVILFGIYLSSFSRGPLFAAWQGKLAGVISV